ncbi:hypothetical protein [Paenibacillus solani]|uniref:hypothetical protein n=1 Tax=Paenibacillus solani TaxID=1705565 RepID=UPI003D27E3ED
MNKEEAILEKYGLEPELQYRGTLRCLLEKEINNEDSEDNEYLKTLCIMLFSIGEVEDSLIIWEAKQKNFDTSCYIDVQLLFGAGYDNTINYLMTIASKEANQETNHLKKRKDTDFANFSKSEIINNYKKYYGINA